MSSWDDLTYEDVEAMSAEEYEEYLDGAVSQVADEVYESDAEVEETDTSGSNPDYDDGDASSAGLGSWW